MCASTKTIAQWAADLAEPNTPYTLVAKRFDDNGQFGLVISETDGTHYSVTPRGGTSMTWADGEEGYEEALSDLSSFGYKHETSPVASLEVTSTPATDLVQNLA